MLTITFKVGTDSDMAQVRVQNRIQQTRQHALVASRAEQSRKNIIIFYGQQIYFFIFIECLFFAHKSHFSLKHTLYYSIYFLKKVQFPTTVILKSVRTGLCEQRQT